ncbi:MAG TPA: ABC transporter ATP-binding protein [Candidatus Baltobacteraceae bacterium]|jgi:ABC-2 type transport system ATP-binding protein|nr:ABC transporter ATP-binding protein [Candidatus Baltobacteraceae bacterium]
MIALEAKGLRKCYTAVPAVSDVNFSVRSGQVLGCLGANGAGKSTIVKMLTGLSEPTRGQVLSFGASIHKDLVVYRRRLGYVPEEPELYSFLSGWEYLELVGTLRALEHRRMEKKIDALLELFSLAPHRHSAIGSYSKGMRQRILLIAALLHDPEILILDEPLSGLDVVSAMVVKGLIKALGERGKAIFYCSHVLEVVEKVCSHVMILRKGTVIAYAPTVELQTMAGRSSLEDAFIHLVADRDAEQTASDIVSVISAA